MLKSQNCNNQQKYSFCSQSCHFTQMCFLLSLEQPFSQKATQNQWDYFLLKHHFLFHIETLITSEQLILPKGGELVSI